MELIVTLAMKFWMWTILIALIIIGLLLIYLTRNNLNYTFTFTDYPLMKHKFATKGKGFFTMINVDTRCQTLGNRKRL